jgi:hypothetical protein
LVSNRPVDRNSESEPARTSFVVIVHLEGIQTSYYLAYSTRRCTESRGR